MHKRKSVS